MKGTLKSFFQQGKQIMRSCDQLQGTAHGRMSHTQALMSIWPDLCNGEERTEAVKAWYEKLNPRLDTALDEWFRGEQCQLRSEFIAASFREAIANSMACAARTSDPKSKLWRERLTGRALRIQDVLVTQVDTALARPVMERGIIIIVIWGEHGAHFPDS